MTSQSGSRILDLLPPASRSNLCLLGRMSLIIPIAVTSIAGTASPVSARQSRMAELPSAVLATPADAFKYLIWTSLKMGYRVISLRISSKSHLRRTSVHTPRFSSTVPPLTVRKYIEPLRMDSCQSCLTPLCTTCHVASHKGLSCAGYKELSSEGTKVFKAWKRENGAKDRPKCGMTIQKSYNCNHRECAVCHVHICWVCLMVYDTGPEVYGHMQREHDSFV